MALRAGVVRRVAVVSAALAGLVWVALAERRTEEHANRLQRSGRLAEAAAVYRERAEDDSSAARLRYNLGTTLLGLDAPGATEELARGEEGSEGELRARAAYNLALWSLRRAMEAETTDSARAHARRAVSAGKRALRSAPGRADAAWNLAMAQRMLDTLELDATRTDEDLEGSSVTEDILLSDALRPVSRSADLADAPRPGADEALARADAADLSPAQAEEILSMAPPTLVIIRKLLAYEGRSQRRLRGRRSTPRW